MEFIPNAAVEQELLDAIGLESVDELFSDIPKDVRASGLDLPPAISELEVEQKLRAVLARNRSTDRFPSFVGGSLKEHHVPAFVGHILSRQEFYTSYTPYQAELSQGTLQALFEFQSMLGGLTGLDVANASMYDWSTALAEAMLMARRVTGRKVVLVPRHMSPEKRSTIDNYCRPAGIRVDEYGFDGRTGESEISAVRAALSSETAAVYLESPNFWGVWETAAAEISQAAQDVGALAVHGFDLSSLAMVRSPGDLGADVAVGDGTTFCFPPSLGGPQLGLLSCRRDLARKMPGRLIGATVDAHGARAYCMTLQTREQHIRRDKATSNICTNQSLLAVGVAAHLAALGPHGLQRLGRLNATAGAGLARAVEASSPWKRAFTGTSYNEVTLRGPMDGDEVYEQLGGLGITPGFPAGRAVPEMSDALVSCSTELHGPADWQRLADALREVSQ